MTTIEERRAAEQERTEEVVATYYECDGNVTHAAQRLGIRRYAVRHHLKKAGIKKPLTGGTPKPKRNKKLKLPKKGIKRYIFTSAQNNTLINEKVWKNILALRDHYDAELMVGTYSYNINAYGKLAVKRGHAPTGHDEELWFDEVLLPYIRKGDDKNIEIAPGLMWCGRANILPTAARPLTGFETYSGRKSGIFPHAKIAMDSIASGKHDATKFNYTTGTVTTYNYIQKKAGLKAEHHHAYGALLVEVTADGDWFVRQLHAGKNGEIYDLTVLAQDGKVTEGHRVEAATWGDIHHARLDPTMDKMIWDHGGVIDVLKPKVQFMHDLIDFQARNHHERGDPHRLFELHVKGIETVETEMANAAAWLNRAYREGCKTVVVNSNHDNAFERWLRETDYKRDPVNAEYFLESQLAKYRSIREDQEFHAVEWAMRRAKCPKSTKFLQEDESYVVKGIECGMHGHLGINGARATALGLSKMGRKANTAHTHSACIIDGLYVAGLSGQLDLRYNKGPSSWSQAFTITYPNGRRTIVTAWNGKWRA